MQTDPTPPSIPFEFRTFSSLLGQRAEIVYLDGEEKVSVASGGKEAMKQLHELLSAVYLVEDTSVYEPEAMTDALIVLGRALDPYMPIGQR